MTSAVKSVVSRAMMTTSSAYSHLFQWRHGGGKVELAGSFNGWKPVEMEKSDETLWRLVLPVGLGRHEFKFVVDGKWVHDPELNHDVNELGSHNNFVVIENVENGVKENGHKVTDEAKSDEDDEEWELVEKPDVLEKLPARSSTMEIERKFVVPENYQSLLEQHGFQMVQALEEKLQDKYFDTPDHHLLQMDFWLRQRNGDWELKYPIGSQHADDGSMLYHETSNSEDILARIRPILPSYVDGFEVFGGGQVDNGGHQQDLNEMVESGMLKPFAQIDTKRQWFQQGDISIVIDDTDWGYRIGEIEILISDSNEISNAVDKIDSLAKLLNFSDFDMLAVAKKLCANSL